MEANKDSAETIIKAIVIVIHDINRDKYNKTIAKNII